MRFFACLLLLSVPGLAREVGQLRLAFYGGIEYFEASDCRHCSVKLLIGGRDSGIEFDYEESRFNPPFGKYTLVVEAPGFVTYQREVLVSEPRVDLLVGLEIGQIADYAKPPPSTRLEGRIQTDKIDTTTLWVRALPVFGAQNWLFDSRVDAKGRFSITLYPPKDSGHRKYALLVLAPRPAQTGISRTDLGIVWLQEVDAPQHETTKIEIELE